MAVSPPRHRGTKVAVVALMTLAVVLGGSAVAGALYLQHKLDAGIERFGDPFAALSSRPVADTATGPRPLNFLVLGSDSRVSAGDPEQWVAGAQRTDAIMVIQVSAARDSVHALSLPRDAWVEIPGHGEHKLNAAFSLGGPALTVQTVEELTGIRIDHVAIADFEAFAELTDSVGGVPITLDSPLDAGEHELAPGAHVLDGTEALAYVRQRAGLPGGDLSRIERQQEWVRSMLAAVRREGLLTDPARLVEFLEAAGRTVAVDDGLTVHVLRNLVFSMRDLRPADLTFVTAPHLGTGRSPDGGQSVVQLDDAALAELSHAFAAGTVAEYLAQHPEVSGSTLAATAR